MSAYLGFAGAGPLTIEPSGGDEPYVHIGLADQGMYVTPRQARAIARDLLEIAEVEQQGRSQG